MSPAGVLSCLYILVLSAAIRSDAYYHSRMVKCSFSSPDFSDAEYTDTVLFGRRVVFEFKSSLGKYIGYTEIGIQTADILNNGPVVKIMRAMLQSCKGWAALRTSSVLSKTVEPKVKLKAVKQFGSKHTARLICSAYNFYPKHINISWLRDGHEVTGDVTYTEELADGDWYYQSHSYLEYDPKPGEKVSCLVEHASFKGPKIYEWNPLLPGFQKSRIAVGAAGLLLGTVTAVAGLVYYRRKHRGRILVPH